jgi:hypothetical protein
MQKIIGTLLNGPCRMPFYTDLQEVFKAFNGREKKYNWLVTGLECNIRPEEFQPFDSNFFFDGSELSDLILRQTKPIQFIWGVFTGFPKNIKIDPERLPLVPNNTNPGFWIGKPKIQYPGGLVELICFDSALTLLLTPDNDLAEAFRLHFPEAVDLEKANRDRKRQLSNE